MTDQITELLEKVPNSGRSGKYMDRLTDESREVLGLFKTWLVTDDHKSQGTANGYSGYVAQALCHIEDGGDVKELSTDVRSALNALRRFHDAGVVEAGEKPAEVIG